MTTADQTPSDYQPEVRQKGEHAMTHEEVVSYEQAIADLAEKAVGGGQDVDVALAALVQGMPDDIKTSMVQQFRSLVAEKEKEQSVPDEMNLEQKKLMEMHQARERSMLAHWLSKETLEKIKEAMLVNPVFMQQVLSLGDELQKKGVFLDTQRQQVTAAEIGGIATQQVGTKQQDIETVKR